MSHTIGLALVTSYPCDKFLHKEKPVELCLSDGHCHLVFVGYHLKIEMYYKFSGFTQRLTGAAPSTAYSPQVRARDSVFERFIQWPWFSAVCSMWPLMCFKRIARYGKCSYLVIL